MTCTGSILHPLLSTVQNFNRVADKHMTCELSVLICLFKLLSLCDKSYTVVGKKKNLSPAEVRVSPASLPSHLSSLHSH